MANLLTVMDHITGRFQEGWSLVCAALLAVKAGCFHLLLGGGQCGWSLWMMSQLRWLLEGDLCLGGAAGGGDIISNRVDSGSRDSFPLS